MLIVEVDGALNVAAIVFVFKSAVDDDDTVVCAVVLCIKNVGHGILGDARETVGVVVGDEMGKLESVLLLDLHCRREWSGGRNVEAFVILPHDVVRVLEHAEGSADLLSRRSAERRSAIGRFTDVAAAR